MRTTLAKLLIACLIAFALTACGSGGGGGGGDGGSGTIGDLVITTFSAPSTGVTGTSYTVTGTIKNQGGAPTAVLVQIYLSSTSNVTVDGAPVGNDYLWGFLDAGATWPFEAAITIPSNMTNGTYYLNAVAQGDDPSVGANNVWSSPVSFTVSGGTTCTSNDAFEPDNTFGTAKTLAYDAVQEHNHCEGTSDWMKFSAVQGTVYGFSAARIGSSARPILSIYDTDGTTLLTSTSFGTSLITRVTWTAPETGTYYVKAYPWMGLTSAGANTEYRMMLGSVLPDLVVDYTYASSSGLPGGIIWVSDTVRNQGFVSAGTFTVSYYLSTNSTVTTGDVLIGSRTVGSLGRDQSSYSSTLPYTLPAVNPGTYYLAAIVNPQGTVSEHNAANNTGTPVAIDVQSLGTCEADQYEQDDLATSTTTTIEMGDTQMHNHCDDTVDWIKLPMVNGSYSIRLTRSGVSNAWVELYDTTGNNRIAGNSSNGTTAIDWMAAADGTYYLKVGDNGSPLAGKDYTIQVQPTLPDLTESVYPLSSNSVVAGGFLDIADSVSNVGYQNAGAFEVGIYYSVSSSVTTSDYLGATRSVAGLPNQGYESTNTTWNSVHFPKNLSPGTYYLAAIADHNSSLPELNESNNTSSAIMISVVAPPCALDAYEDDDTPSSAAAIAAGETQTRNFCDDELDWVSFTPSADGMYVVSAPNVFVSPYQVDGITPVTTHDTYFYSKFSFAATASTTYYLKGYNGSGAYQLTVFQCTPDSFEDDDTAAGARDIALNETQTRNQCEDRNDWAKFTATAGTSYAITAASTTNQNVNVYLTLYGPDGQTYLASGSSAKGGQQQVISSWTAPASDTYFIKVDRFEFGQNTDYTLNLK